MAFHSNYYDMEYADRLVKQLRLTYIVIVAFFILAGAVLFFLVRRDWNILVFCGVVALVFALVGLFGFRARTTNIKSAWLKKMRKRIDVPENAIFFGLRTMEFDDEKVMTSTDKADGTVAWEAFIRVSETPDHFFLYTSNLQALIIPKRAMTEAQVGEMIQLLNNKIKK